jgi:hypothetical protein
MMPMAAFYPGSGRTSLPVIPAVASACVGSAAVNESLSSQSGDGNMNETADVDSNVDGSGSDESSSFPDAIPCRRGAMAESDLLDIYSQRNDLSHCDPIIVDVGVALPSTNTDDPSLELHIAGGKAIFDFAYRVQWRDYFRFVTVPL